MKMKKQAISYITFHLHKLVKTKPPHTPEVCLWIIALETNLCPLTACSRF